MTDYRYPIGPFRAPERISPQDLQSAIDDIAALPSALRSATGDLNEEQIDAPYRPGGWTVRQLVHHVADSHMNAYTRFRLALTEENPTIKPYEEAAWAELVDARTLPIGVSLDLLDAMHDRLVHLLRATPAE